MRIAFVCCVLLLVNFVPSAFADQVDGLWGGLKAGLATPQYTSDQPGYLVGATFLTGSRHSNVAVEGEVNYLTRYFADQLTTSSIDLSLGGQYRIRIDRNLIPYAKAGGDILINSANGGYKLKSSYGGHVAAGIDYFVDRQFALNVELRQIITTQADISKDSVKAATFDATCTVLTVGIRFN